MAKLANLEENYQSSHRFKNVSELWDRYNQLKTNTLKDREAWKNFMKSYERWSYKKANGSSDPNWGRFRGKVDKIIETFESLVTERQHWARIVPLDVPDDADRDFISDKLTSEFHELCIRPWEDREHNTRLSIFDMVMFSKGIEMWEAPCGVYPESIPVDRVFPDSKASMKPKEWDLCFVEKQYTPVELYDEIQDDDRAEVLGWKKNSIKRLLKHIGLDAQSDVEGITDERGGQDSFNCEPDLKITIIQAYVREYKADEDGKRISLYSFVHNNYVRANTQSSGGSQSDTNNSIGFLRVHEGIARDMSEVISLSSHLVARNYYRCPSEAEMVYAACKFYDQGINRVIRAVYRNMSLILKSMNQDQQEKLKSLDTEESIVLDPDVEILQQRTHQDVKGVVETIRQVMMDTDDSSGISSPTGSQNVKGRPITAREAQIQLSETSSSQRKDIRLYVLQEKRKVSEMYRRFVSDECMIDGDEGYENHKLFLKRMRKAGIPKSIFKPENILVEPVFFNFGEPPSTIIEKAQMRLQALRQLATSTTPGEQRTIRDIIAATSTYQDSEQYMDRSNNEAFQMESILKAGFENELMADPYLNRRNIHVSSGDKHLIEIPLHLQDVEYKINNAIGLLKNLENTPEEQVPILLDDITDIVVAMDNQAAHIEAHIMLASQDQTVKGGLQGFSQKLNELRGMEKAVEMQLSITQQSRVQSNRERLVNDEKLRHLQQANQEQERHQQEQNKLDSAKSISKFEFAIDAKKRKTQQDLNIANQKASIDIAKKMIETDEDVKKAKQTSKSE